VGIAAVTDLFVKTLLTPNDEEPESNELFKLVGSVVDAVNVDLE
jgi:hypothetical protein